MLFTKSLLCLLAQGSLLCHALATKPLLSRHSIAVDEPNFLDYVSCEEQPKGTCTLTLVLTPDGNNMGALVFDNECELPVLPLLTSFMQLSSLVSFTASYSPLLMHLPAGSRS